MGAVGSRSILGEQSRSAFCNSARADRKPPGVIARDAPSHEWQMVRGILNQHMQFSFVTYQQLQFTLRRLSFQGLGRIQNGRFVPGSPHLISFQLQQNHIRSIPMSFKATRKSHIQLAVKVQALSEPCIWAGGYLIHGLVRSRCGGISCHHRDHRILLCAAEGISHALSAVFVP